MTGAAGQLQRARAMIDVGRFDDAITLLGPVVAAEPDNDRAWALLAQAHIGAQRPAEGLAAAGQALQLDPASAWAHRLRSIALRMTGHADAAMQPATEACRLEPHSWLNHLNLAQASLAASKDPHNLAGAVQAATDASANARRLAPNEPSVHYVSGQVSRARGQAQEAVSHFRQVLALDPEHSGALNELGRIDLDRGRSGAAARHFVLAARVSPGQGAYGHNVEVAVARVERSVRNLVRWVIYGSWLLVIIAMLITHPDLATKIAMLALIGLAAIAVAGFLQVQLRRLPKEARPLFRGGSMLLALGISLSSLLVGVVTIEFLAGGVGQWLTLVVVLLLAARYAAFRVLRRGALKRHEELLARSAAVKAQ
jgi:tetratricopeptide (TPR) repeat protein